MTFLYTTRGVASEPEILKSRIAQSPDDYRWHSGFHRTGFDERVYGFAVYGGELIATGMFTRVGGTLADLIARWDGADWQPLGAGIPVGHHGETLVTFEGRLIVGGSFRQAGDVEVGNIAAWDGTRWHAMGNGVNGWVFSLCVFRDTLIAGGNFTEADGKPAGGIAFWDGTSWNALSSGVAGAWATVNSMIVYNEALIVAGSFSNFAGVEASNIASWNGDHATPLEQGTSMQVEAVAQFHDDLIAGGWFSNAGGRPTNGIAAWSGSTWRDIGGVRGGGYPGVLSLAVQQDSLYVGGIFTEAGGIPANNVATWNGSTWHSLTSGTSNHDDPLPPGIHAIQPFNAEVFFGGAFLFAGDLYTPGIAKWTGTTWQAVAPGQGIPGSIYEIDTYDRKIVVGGSFPWAGDDMDAYCIALWNGTSWNALGTGVDKPVTTIQEFNGDLIVGGKFEHASGIPVSYVARWDGTTWHPMGDGFDGWVWELVENAGVLYAGGAFTKSGSTTLNHVAQWDGAAWVPLGAGLDEAVISLAIHQDTLIAGGNFSYSGSTPVPFVAKWDGQQWLPIGGGLKMSVRALATFRGDLIAGGSSFVNWTPGMPEPLARWNGSQWEGIYGGSTDFWQIYEVNALHVLNDKLFAGGLYRSIGGIPIESIARWDGLAWTPVGSGTNNTVYALQSQSGMLLVGGGFSAAGGKGASGFAIWDEVPTSVRLYDLGAARSAAGIIITWKMRPPGSADARIRVQRSLAEKGPYADRHDSWLDLRQTTQFEDPDTATENVYWYRIMLESSDAGKSIIGPIRVEALRVGALENHCILAVAPTADGALIRYRIATGPVPVLLAVFDARGRRVVVLDKSIQPPGEYVRYWNERDGNGRTVPNGLYFVLLTADRLKDSVKYSLQR